MSQHREIDYFHEFIDFCCGRSCNLRSSRYTGRPCMRANPRRIAIFTVLFVTFTTSRAIAVNAFVPGALCKQQSGTSARYDAVPSVYSVSSPGTYFVCPLLSVHSTNDIQHVYVDLYKEGFAQDRFNLCIVDVNDTIVSCIQRTSVTPGQQQIAWTTLGQMPTEGNMALYTYIQSGALGSRSYIESVRYDQY